MYYAFSHWELAVFSLFSLINRVSCFSQGMYWGAVFCAITVSTSCYRRHIDIVLHNLFSVQIFTSITKNYLFKVFFLCFLSWMIIPIGLSMCGKGEEIIVVNGSTFIIPYLKSIKWNCTEMQINYNLCFMLIFTEKKSLQNELMRNTFNYLTFSVSKLPLFQIQHDVSGERSTYWFCGSQRLCMCDCFVNLLFYPYPHSHHNLGLIMPSCFCNLNIYPAPRQHPQSSTLHLHTDAGASRSARFAINTVCHQHLLGSELKLARTFLLRFSQQKCLF